MEIYEDDGGVGAAMGLAIIFCVFLFIALTAFESQNKCDTKSNSTTTTCIKK